MILRSLMARNLVLISSLVVLLGFTPHKALSWRNQSFVDDISAPCPPSPHPLAMCKSQAAAYGYPCEDYTVTTKDGYILSLQRIPHGRSHSEKFTRKRRPPVLLFHGLMVDGVVWVLGTPEESPAFILADNGFDVWIANSRGTTFSRNHTSIPANDLAYWDWSWDEIATYDLPAVFQFVYNRTGGRKIHYIGHSLGTLVILATFSEHNLLDMVRSAALLCPIAYLGKMESKLALLAVRIFLAETIHWLGFREFNPIGPIAHEILTRICKDPDINCYDILSAVAVVRDGEIRRYDYGNSKDNMEHYNQPRAPLYNLSSIPSHLPLFLTHGGRDFLGDLPDTRRLLVQLLSKHEKDNIEVLFIPPYAHADFMMGYNAPDLIYKPIVAFFKRH